MDTGADVWILRVTETDGAVQDFEVNGEAATLGCAWCEYDAPTTARVEVIDPSGAMIGDLRKGSA